MVAFGTRISSATNEGTNHTMAANGIARIATTRLHLGFDRLIGAPSLLASLVSLEMGSHVKSFPVSQATSRCIGETTYMIGGNIKGLYLNLHPLRVPGTWRVSRLGFHCEEWPFIVTLLQREVEGN